MHGTPYFAYGETRKNEANPRSAPDPIHNSRLCLASRSFFCTVHYHHLRMGLLAVTRIGLKLQHLLYLAASTANIENNKETSVRLVPRLVIF